MFSESALQPSLLRSWGRVVRYRQFEIPLFWEDEIGNVLRSVSTSVLPYGLGRSYGSSCLNEDATLLLTRPLSRFLAFNETSGVLRCEAGVSLAEIINTFLPRGWFLPVTPGTKFVTVGGAIANDVHGKNHHRAGTLGCHVLRFGLARSDRSEPIVCSRSDNSELFAATIGGMGLTGLITWAELKLKRIPSLGIEAEFVRFANLEEFFSVSEESDQGFEYTVAWVDCLATKKHLGRGIFIRGNHSAEAPAKIKVPSPSPKLQVPVEMPDFVLNKYTISLFNQLYYRKQLKDKVAKTVPFDSFFYPLDALSDWNRIYGPRGFFQYQFVLPLNHTSALAEIFQVIAKSKLGSFLAVLKKFGDVPSPGLLSFPMAGPTLCLDFPNKGERTEQLFTALDDLVRRFGGRLYPAKSTHQSAEFFRETFPMWSKFKTYVDPKFSSSFWRKVSKS